MSHKTVTRPTRPLAASKSLTLRQPEGLPLLHDHLCGSDPGKTA